jgi:hypothetical protein
VVPRERSEATDPCWPVAAGQSRAAILRVADVHLPEGGPGPPHAPQRATSGSTPMAKRRAANVQLGIAGKAGLGANNRGTIMRHPR